MSAAKRNPSISVVSPVYNNANHIAKLAGEISAALDRWRLEIILVDDGSTDNSWQIITSLAATGSGRHRVRGLKLSRNFGQHAAIYAGLRNAGGDFIAVLDADLQDDPRYLPEMLSLMTGQAGGSRGFDIVHTRRIKKKRTLRVMVSQVVYRVLTWASEIPLHPAMGNYKLLSRRALTAALAYNASQPLFELMVKRAGFPATQIDVERRTRPVDTSAYSFADSLGFIGRLLVSYSSLFFRIALYLGLGLAAAGLAGLFAFAETRPVIISALAVVVGSVFLMGGLIGYYVRFLQVSGRGWPVFVVEEKI